MQMTIPNRLFQFSAMSAGNKGPLLTQGCGEQNQLLRSVSLDGKQGWRNVRFAGQVRHLNKYSDLQPPVGRCHSAYLAECANYGH